MTRVLLDLTDEKFSIHVRLELLHYFGHVRTEQPLLIGPTFNPIQLVVIEYCFSFPNESREKERGEIKKIFFCYKAGIVRRERKKLFLVRK